jgi:DNA-directed RNA polymerase subunit M/transcription elongation factor TFIIS
MRFCTNNGCDNILTTTVKGTSVIYKCLACNEEYKLAPVDTLMIDEYLQENDSTHKHFMYLRNAHADRITELAKIKCPARGCKETIVNVVKIAQNGQSLYVCPTCEHHFHLD